METTRQQKIAKQIQKDVAEIFQKEGRELGRRIRNQIKSIPELQFFLDDSLEYIEHIEQALRND